MVRFTHLQKERTARRFKYLLDQLPGDAVAAKLGIYGKVEDFSLVRRGPATGDEADDAIFRKGDQARMGEIVGGLPARGSGRCRLDARDFIEIGWQCRARNR